jgi:fatty-acyl-CoA synthase
MYEPHPQADRAQLTPVCFLERSASVYSDRIAVVHENRRYMYRELGTRVNRLAWALRRAGLQKGEPVVFICPNTPALLEAHFGVPAAGGVLVALNYRLAPRDIYPVLEHSRTRFVFVDREYEHLVEDAEHLVEDCGHIIRVIPIDDTGEPGDPYEAFIAGGSPQPVATVLEDERDPISISYTSGTTGKPYSHRGAYLNALDQVIETRMTPESVHLWTLPMFHCNGWCFPWAVTAVGARHVCMREVDPARIWELIDEEGVTHYSAPPTVQASLLGHPDAHAVGREIVTAVSGSRPTRELLTRLTEVGFRPVHVYA